MTNAAKKIIIEDAPDLANLKNKDDPNFPFIALDIKRLTTASRNINCDIFIRLSDEKMTRVFSLDSGLDFLRLKQYMEKGVKEVFIRKEDFEKFSLHLQNSPEAVLNKDNTDSNDKVKALIDLADQNVTDFFSKVPVAEISVEKTKTIIRRMIGSLSKDPKLLASLMRMVQHHEFMLNHSISVSIIAMLLARGAKNANEKTLEICGIGGFLHDIGKTQVNPDIVAKYADLTPEQWKEMRHHPLLGVKMLERCNNISDEVKLIVMQHHEQPGGGGYPDGIRGPKIFYPSKIIAIADIFAAMISNKSFKKTYTPAQAIYEMLHEPGKFDKELIQIAAGLFKLE